ncbi:hypothetical protein [Streptomyces sp. NBC_01353]|uniref:hypothetical protein n=1 Tax=Streptomyces sp. NBC_01353 TaxID=2903835 RepID=UPI002E2EACB4|nr:hypothetical protein [Streptomyces sp. NBC_01353]
MDASTVVGVLVVAGGAALMATGAARKGRAVRPLRPARARAAAERADSRVLLRAAGMAIASARDAAGHGEPAIVTVEDVMRLAVEHFGRTEVPREQAAAALRLQYERAACATDCVTDAFG